MPEAVQHNIIVDCLYEIMCHLKENLRDKKIQVPFTLNIDDMPDELAFVRDKLKDIIEYMDEQAREDKQKLFDCSLLLDKTIEEYGSAPGDDAEIRESISGFCKVLILSYIGVYPLTEDKMVAIQVLTQTTFNIINEMYSYFVKCTDSHVKEHEPMVVANKHTEEFVSIVKECLLSGLNLYEISFFVGNSIVQCMCGCDFKYEYLAEDAAKVYTEFTNRIIHTCGKALNEE